MAKQNILAPNVGESITEVSVLKWRKGHGEAVKTGEVLLEVESEKATVEVISESTGTLQILKKEGERVPVGEILAFVDDSITPTANAKSTAAPAGLTPVTPAPAPAPTMSPNASRMMKSDFLNDVIQGVSPATHSTLANPANPATPATSGPVSQPTTPQREKTIDKPGDRRVPMSRLRARIAERLVQAQHNAAILTTFNEIDMKNLMDLRNQYKDKFKAQGLPMSFMTFFTVACCEALKQLQGVNGSIDGNDIIYHDYQDIGIAVGTNRGLVVPVVRDAGQMTFTQIDKAIMELANKARDGKLSIADMTGGTFTISNGGTYGSLLSTPILNPPQSAILGMHKTMDRPIVVNGKIEIRPMMYVALSYDHRIIDGKEAVTFLVTVKDLIENPQKMKLGL